MNVSKSDEAKRRIEFPKADMVHRAVGRLADVIIVLVVVRLLPGAVGAVIAISYILLADGIFRGQSPGKRLGGVKVMSRRTGLGALYWESLVRNIPFAIVVVSWFVPLLGLILFPVVGLFVVAFELYMAWTDKLGLRIGDVLAETQVVDASVAIEDPAPSPLSNAKSAMPPEPEGA